MRSADVRTSTQRLAVVRGVMLACLVGLAARATHLAVFDPKGAARGAAQTERTLTLAAVRGQIVDRRGQALAVSVDAPSVFAIPGQIQITFKFLAEWVRSFHSGCAGSRSSQTKLWGLHCCSSLQ